MNKEDMVDKSAIQKNDILPFAATWMDLEGILLSEVKSEKDKYYIILLICRSKKKKKYNKLMNKTKKKQTYRYREQNNGYQRGGRRGNTRGG